MTVRNLQTGAVFTDRYDKLILATGARAALPPIAGMDLPHVFTLRAMADMRRIKAFLDARKLSSAAIVGAGSIGLEMVENLHRLGIRVTVLERLPQVVPGLDADMAVHVEAHLRRNGVAVQTSVTVEPSPRRRACA